LPATARGLDHPVDIETRSGNIERGTPNMWRRLLITGAASATVVLTVTGVAYAQEANAGVNAGANAGSGESNKELVCVTPLRDPVTGKREEIDVPFRQQRNAKTFDRLCEYAGGVSTYR
jgi:hypothetical protein